MYISNMILRYERKIKQTQKKHAKIFKYPTAFMLTLHSFKNPKKMWNYLSKTTKMYIILITGLLFN